MLLLLSLTVLVVGQCESVTFYVTPLNSPNHCPQLCHTIDYYSSSSFILSAENGADGTTFAFLKGEHFLQNKSSLILANSTTVNLIGYLKTIPTLSISRDSVLQATNISFFTIESLKIIGEYDIVQNSYIAWQQQIEISTTTALLIGVQLSTCYATIDSEELEIQSSSLIGTTLASSCSLHHFQTAVLNNTETVDSQLKLGMCEYSNSTSLKLVHCNITSHANLPGIETGLGNGVTYTFIELRDTRYGGKLAINLEVANMHKTLRFHVVNCTFRFIPIRQFIIQQQPNLIQLIIKYAEIDHSPSNVQFIIENTEFDCNKWTCVYINIPFTSGDKINVTITNSDLTGSNQALVAVKSHYYGDYVNPSSLFIQLYEVIVRSFVKKYNLAAIQLNNVNKLIVTDCKFINNECTAMETYNSVIAFSGEVLFRNNTGSKGGALSLYNSRLFFHDNSQVYFDGNTAKEVGGAMYIKIEENINSNTEPSCFYTRNNSNPNQFDSKDHKVNVWFSNNWASNGGHDIYGGYLNNRCRFWKHTYAQCYILNKESYKFHTNNTISPTAVTCSPTRVCLCNEQGLPECADMDFIDREISPLFPGEKFTVPAVLVGCSFGTTAGTVYSKVLQGQGETFLSQTQEIQEVRSLYNCTQLQYALQSPTVGSMRTAITLSARPYQRLTRKTRKECHLNKEYISTYHRNGIIRDKLLYHTVYLRLTLKKCPLGFMLRQTPPYICSCHPRLEEKGVKICTISNHTGYVYRNGATWVSLTETKTENTTDFVINQYCPNDYCKSENISVDLESPNTQCDFNRSGILCGGCLGNLSLVLGSSRCLPCNNEYGFLVIAFILVGALLVIFIKLLDTTVSKGTINGLIFYANIVWGSKSILFSTKATHPALKTLHTFVAWLNLDLGIETCFINGLDAYWKTWLQFTFPAYVWCITGAIILASRYSTRASRIFGHNSVPVLSTLILLSYTKLLRNIFNCLSYSVIESSRNFQIVWTVDGNINYLSGQHIILFLAAVAILLLLWLPFTLFLLTHQCLKRKTHFKPLNWINRWKPFFDAYLGQFKYKIQYWFGLLLIVRVILLLLFAITSTSTPRINLLAITFMGVGLLFHCVIQEMPYKTKWLSLLEMSFILNLTLLASFKLYIESNTTADIATTYISIGIVFIQFLAIVAYHVIIRVRVALATYKRRNVSEANINTHTEMKKMSTNFYREPLLESLH